MSAAEERWDVVVVGLHDPDPNMAGALAAELGSMCGMAPADIEAALNEGEVPVHAGLRRHEAERAASDLDRLGAAVDLRLSAADGSAYPIFKPDAERRSGTAVGGFIDDSATPPRFAASGVHDLPLEPEPEGPPLGVGASAPERVALAPEPPVVARKRTVGLEPPSPVPPPPAHNAFAAPPVPGFGGLDVGGMGQSNGQAPDALSALSSELDKIAAGDADALLGTIDGSEPIKGKPEGPARPREFDRVVSRPSAAQRQAARDARAKAKADSSESVPTRPRASLEPVSPEPEPRLEPEPAPPPKRTGPVDEEPAAPPPKKSSKKKKKKNTGQMPAESAKLELDFEAAGLAAVPVGGVLTGESQSGPSGVMPRRTRSTDAGGTGMAARLPDADEDQPLLGPDRIAAALFGGAIGLGLSLVVAVFLHKGAEQETIVGLEAELQQTLVDPGKVESGALRDAASIEADLESEYGDVRRTFLLQWLLIGAPIGFVVGRLKRFR